MQQTKATQEAQGYVDEQVCPSPAPLSLFAPDSLHFCQQQFLLCRARLRSSTRSPTRLVREFFENTFRHTFATFPSRRTSKIPSVSCHLQSRRELVSHHNMSKQRLDSTLANQMAYWKSLTEEQQQQLLAGMSPEVATPHPDCF